MGVFDKILNVMHLGDEDYDDEEYDDDFDDDEEEDGLRSSLFSRKSKDDDSQDAAKDKTGIEKKSFISNSKITPLRSKKSGGNDQSMEVCVFKPSSFEDAREIGETLLAGQTVILNMEGVDVALAQRIVDFASGACFALEGNLQKVSNFMFVITPHNVAISGDLQELVNNFDFSGIQTGF
ncbi:MAG: cell division protein SepF [Lachnospiraceae bacterium]|nr:cell division protein SepF [Lachnospiraceae bacterium]